MKVCERLLRLARESGSEVTLCLNPNTEGDVTNMYLVCVVKPLVVKIAHLAKCLRVGEKYSGEIAPIRVLVGRHEVGQLPLTFKLHL